MKKQLFAIFALISLLCGCSSSEDIQEVVPTEPMNITFTADIPQTRTVIDEKPSGQVSPWYWENSDAIYIVQRSAGKILAKLTIDSGSGTTTGLFKGTAEAGTIVDGIYDIYYFGRGAIVNETTSLQHIDLSNQTGSKYDLGKFDVMMASAVITVNGNTATVAPAQMSKLLTVLHFNVKSTSTIPLESIGIRGTNVYASADIDLTTGSLTNLTTASTPRNASINVPTSSGDVYVTMFPSADVDPIFDYYTNAAVYSNEKVYSNAGMESVTGMGKVTLDAGKLYRVNENNGIPVNCDKPQVIGGLPGEFSVSATEKIRFSGGNLEWIADASEPAGGYFCFANEQYDEFGYCDGVNPPTGNVTDVPGKLNTTGTKTSNSSDNKQTSFDLFGWGTSGFNGIMPYLNIINSDMYAPYKELVTDRNYGWGTYNTGEANYIAGRKIYENRSKQNVVTGDWYALTSTQIHYLLDVRPNHDNLVLKGSIAVIVDGDVKLCGGIIILPDNWVNPLTSHAPLKMGFNAGTLGYGNNMFGIDEWKKMEEAGAVMMPATGERSIDGHIQTTKLSDGNYWTDKAKGDEFLTGNDEVPSFIFQEMDSFYGVISLNYKYYGLAVRLVQTVE